ncbi:MAG: hypothetical protein J5857_09645 [Treponema sp.]|nr:hypothetical protein [Treponema sp.]
MKKTHLLLCLIFIPMLSLYAQDSGKNEELDAVTGFPVIKEKPFLMFDWGAAVDFNTRLKFQTERSNFVMQDMMVGAYFTMETVNIMPIDSITRIAAYYPLSGTFNGVPQISKQVILYAFDLIFAPVWRFDMWHYVGINIAPGLHFMYQLTDDYHYMQLGAAVLAGLEFPVFERWTFLLNGVFAVDYPNLGTNKDMFPVSLAWDYQLSIGARYSKKGANKYSYVKSRKDAKEKKKEEELTQTEELIKQ